MKDEREKTYKKKIKRFMDKVTIDVIPACRESFLKTRKDCGQAAMTEISGDCPFFTLHPSSFILRKRGFTLMEVLVAVSILSIVLTAIYSTFLLSQRAIDGMDESMLKLQESRKAIDILRCELDSSYYDTQDVNTFLKIQDRDVYGRQASQLSFTAFSTLRPGLSKVSYYIEDKDGKLNLLKKIESPYGKEETEGVEIIEDLEGFSIEAKHDDTWVKTWDTGVNKGRPEEIRIGLTMLLKGKKVTLYDASRPRIGRAI